MMMSNF